MKRQLTKKEALFPLIFLFTCFGVNVATPLTAFTPNIKQRREKKIQWM